MYKLLTVFILVGVFSINIFSQTPQYYNYQNVGSSSNTFPFGQSAGKAVTWLFLPNDFNMPTQLPSGRMITKVYFFITTGGTRTFTNLHILMAQDVITTLPTSGWYPGPWDTVYSAASVSLTGPSLGWMGVTLDKPFAYDTSKSLIIFVGQCGAVGSGIYVRQNTLPNRRRTYSVGGCPLVASGGDGATVNFGMDVVTALPQYYNYNTNVGNNTFPLNQTAGKMVQWLAGSGEYNMPTPAPSGDITAFYLFLGGSGATGRVYTNFTIRMGRTALTTLPTGALYTGQMDTVYYRPSLSVTAVSSSWMVIPLDNPFTYYSDSSLVFEIGQCGYTPTTGSIYMCQTTLTGNRRSWSVGGCPFVYGGQGGQIAHSGFYIPTPLSANNNNNQVPEAYRLDQNYPNPFNPVTTIGFGIPKSGNVKLTIYDMLGREVTVLTNTFYKAGTYSIDFDATEFSSGVYLYKIEADGFVSSKKMTLVK